jgi:hypothetical protein
MVLLIFIFPASASYLGCSLPLVQYGFLRQAGPVRFSPKHAIN